MRCGRSWGVKDMYQPRSFPDASGGVENRRDAIAPGRAVQGPVINREPDHHVANGLRLSDSDDYRRTAGVAMHVLLLLQVLLHIPLDTRVPCAVRFAR